MINLIGSDDFGKVIHFTLSQVKDFCWRKRSVSIQGAEIEVIDPETVTCADCANLREQVKVLREACRSGLDALGGIMNHYGTGLQVSNWHLNGDTEPWDNFFDGDGCGESLEALSAALEQTKPKGGE